MVSCTSQRISVYLIYYKTEETPCFFIRGTKFIIFTKPIIRAPCLLPQIFHNNCLQFLLGITVVPSKIDDNRKGSVGGGNKLYHGLPSPPTVSFQAFSVNAFRWRIRDVRPAETQIARTTWPEKTSYEDPRQRLKVRVHSATKTPPFHF